MYLAEIHGKLSRENENKEDILTSNVFSFFKYANRKIFLYSFLKSLRLNITPEEATHAEFLFWPSYPDGTQPDLVIIAGSYYLLFESKYRSGFGKETQYKKNQLLREIEGGVYEADGINKQFKIIAVTGDYFSNRKIFIDIPECYRSNCIWINWQKIALLIFTILEEKPNIPFETWLFAEDLYRLLVKKNLRNYEGTRVLSIIAKIYKIERKVFFESGTASYRGDFIGFSSALGTTRRISSIPGNLFYQKEMVKNKLALKTSQPSLFGSLDIRIGTINKTNGDLFFNWRSLHE